MKKEKSNTFFWFFMFPSMCFVMIVDAYVTFFAKDLIDGMVISGLGMIMCMEGIKWSSKKDVDNKETVE